MAPRRRSAMLKMGAKRWECRCFQCGRYLLCQQQLQPIATLSQNAVRHLLTPVRSYHSGVSTHSNARW